MKKTFGFLFGILTGAAMVMLYLHRGALTACLKGEELPEAPESCPFSKND